MVKKNYGVRNKQYQIRLSIGEYSMLEKLSKHFKKPKSEILRVALEEYYDKFTRDLHLL